MANNTFAIITLETPDATYQYINFKITSGTTQTCTGFVADGTSSYQIVIGASTTSAGILSDTTGTNTVTYCTISYSTAQGGATWNATGAGNVNGGNNSGWTFPATGILKRYSGAAWDQKIIKAWGGAAWAEKPLKRYTGSTWATVDTSP